MTRFETDPDTGNKGRLKPLYENSLVPITEIEDGKEAFAAWGNLGPREANE